MDFLLPLVQGLVDKYPVAATIVFSIGILRIIIKPVLAIIRSVADQTPSTKDNEILDKVEASTWLKSLLFILDWLTSIKLPVK